MVNTILKDYEHVVNDYFQKKLKASISNIEGPKILLIETFNFFWK